MPPGSFFRGHMKRVCVFVDGENFRHSIEALFPQDINKYDYLPKKADWASLFDWLVKEATGGEGSRLRAYWYVVGSVDFYPYKLPKFDRDPDSLRIVLAKHDSFRNELESLAGAERLEAMRRMSKMLTSRQETFQSRFRGWHVIQDGISIRHRAVEFRRAGTIGYNLFRKKLGPEKAVDVNLAADLITLREIYDIALIISGDQDYVPAVQVVKDAGKEIVNVSFLTPDGDVLPGGARRLSIMTDSCIEVGHDRLKSYLALSRS